MSRHIKQQTLLAVHIIYVLLQRDSDMPRKLVKNALKP